MKKILNALHSHGSRLDKRVLVLSTCWVAGWVWLNYRFGLDARVNGLPSLPLRFLARYAISLAAWAVPYLLFSLVGGRTYLRQPVFLSLVLAAPAVFALKMSVITRLPLAPDPAWNIYWNQVLYWPLRALLVIVPLLAAWKCLFRAQPFFGLTARGISWTPYLLMLACMIPLIALAATRPDFQASYPKLDTVDHALRQARPRWAYAGLFELAYGSDFFTIELFFRGFLVLALARWAGPDAILAMACFYCTIHFGKPLGECISSYFGGYLLGIVIYETGSLLGGLVVHLGIAWLMELAGAGMHILK
ncbi:MAG TPA: CPBP family intramembrane glutamic endopeptidase [Chitinophagaceae bacterium]|nr:CPBP family intramembrane glutamic endopeptidase [Chitinophagaceae bacterium]